MCVCVSEGMCIFSKNFYCGHDAADVLSQAKEPRLSHYLTIAGGKRYEFITFSRALAKIKTQAASSRM